MLLGILAAIGGALIYLDPFAGVIAITILIAIIFAFHGVTQIAFAREGPAARPDGIGSWCQAASPCWRACCLVMKLPYSHSFTPATLAGVSLLFAGWAYVAIALTSRKGRNDQLTAKSRECAIAAMQIWT